MKKTLLILATLTLCLQLSALAQIQQGYVKTLGRPNKKGTALSGVTIRVKGQHNPVLSNADGTFSLIMDNMKNGDPYSLQQVQKKGYEINEAGLIGRQQAFSDKVPLTIVMASPNQLRADKSRIEEKAQQVASKNYEKKITQLEQELANKKITGEQYQTATQELLEKFETYQTLINGMAEHYAHTDYDLLNETEREINLCIENGNLERADALIRTLFNPLESLRRNKEALEALDRQIAQAHDLLAQTDIDMAAVLKQQEKDAEYLYQLFTIALGRFDFDQAQQYIDTRAELDTTNVIWQHEAALFTHRQQDFRKAEKYYLRALAGYRSLAADFPETYEEELLFALGDVSYYYLDLERFDKAEEYAQEAIALARKRAEYPSLQDQLNLTDNLILLHTINLSLDRFHEAEKAITEAFNIIKKIAKKHGKDPQILDMYQNTMNSVGFTYYLKDQYTESEKYLTDALDLARQLVKLEPKYIINLPGTLDHLIRLYTQTHQYDLRNQYIQELLEIERKQAKDNPQTYEPSLAISLYDYGSNGIMESKFLDTLVADKDIDTVLFYTSLDYLDEALVLFRKYAHLDYIPYWYTRCLNTLIDVFLMVKDYKTCSILMEEINPFYKEDYEADPVGQKTNYTDHLDFLSSLCMTVGQPDKAETYARELLRVDPSRQDINAVLAPALLLQGKYAEAKKLYLQCKSEMKDSMLEDLELMKILDLIPTAVEDDVERIKQLLND